ncbi:class A beta-lactamase-related serine hydrolase [Streptomyces sp. NBC_01381]|uniref:serine hydrolase n=1 Tax=Streptomyces sp. NBC_01381 TaxID=2903845 RepID=UPI00224D9F72|nr:serine hydrolase [Streptomyces sp. NBC_01381]MCX4667088.1 class A beta-lactamase-related serine hydrolase [Streptomyces sp. NBC_01381]
MTHPISGISRRARVLSAGLTAGVLVPLGAVATATPAAAAAAPSVTCTSAQAGLAAKLTKDITAALKNRTGTVAVGLRDRTTGTTCTLRSTTSFDSASVVKATVLATLLWDAQQTSRALSSREKSLATSMITKSDNAATSTLWRQLGAAKVKGFLRAAGMTKTVPGSGGYWGLTRINATDEQKLLALITGQNTVLTDASRAYLLKLMGKVIPSQRWGTPAGAPSGVEIHVKNGWLQRSTHGWRVHSIGAFKGGGHDYTLSVLTHGNSTMNYGVATIQGVAKAVHKDLAPRTPAAGRYAPTEAPREAFVAAPGS